MKLKDLTGERFGSLTVVSRVVRNNKRTYWKCKCDCGNEKIIEAYKLTHSGNNLSCGCIEKDSARIIDLTGRRFGALTVLSRGGRKYGRIAWLCKCDCSKEVVVTGDGLRSGHYTSCGCGSAQRLRAMRYKHGMSSSRLYKIWSCMKNRCLNTKYPEYHLYGGRGIKVNDAWANSFTAFAEWATENGYRDNLTIDRKDFNGDYAPENCRWATYQEQANNKRNNHVIEYDGKRMTVSEWAKNRGLTYSCLKSRLKMGWSIKVSLEKPVRRRRNGTGNCVGGNN